MRILVLVKQVPDAADVVIDPTTHTLMRSGVEAVMNPYDAHALEAALRLKDAHGGVVTVATMGPKQAEKTLREAVAMGAEAAVLLSDHAFAGSDTFATARVLAAYASREQFDLILCGKQAVDGDTAQVPSELAALLDIPQASNVTALSYDGEMLSAVQSFDEYTVSVRMRLPALVSAVRELADPRFPTLAGYARAVCCRVQTMNAADLGIDPATVGLVGSPTRVVRTHSIALAAKDRRMFTSITDEALRVVAACIGESRSGEKVSAREAVPASVATVPSDLDAMHGWYAVVAQDHVNGYDATVQGLIAALAPFAAGRKTKVAVLTWGDASAYGASGADGVVCLRASSSLSLEARAAAIAACAKEGSFETLVMSAHGCGRVLAPRVAALLSTGLTADCTAFDMDDEGHLLQIRPAFGGDLEATIRCATARPQMATVRPGMFGGTIAPKEHCLCVMRDVCAHDRGAQVTARERVPHTDHDLASASLVFAGGRGVGGVAGFALLAALAERTGGAVAASRGAVDMHLAPYVRQVGQTGRTVTPDVYVACGISGNIQHLVGMRGAKTVIAVNKDPKAPIFSVADIGIVADAKDLLSRLCAVL
jgi:electron transfer flavoprotein alpha subunit